MQAPIPVAAPPPPDPKQSLAGMATLDPATPVTDAQAQAWKQALQDLVRAGPASTPIIKEFLAKNQDVAYPSSGGHNPLGYPTLRAGLIDALSQIGGPEANDALTQILQTTPYPTDLAALSKVMDPQYQESILGAARQQLSVAAQGQLGGVDVGPLFQILASQAAAGVDVTADLTQYATKWPYYSAIALAQLPDGSGLNGLIQMAQGAAGSTQNPGAEALSELAADNPQARSTLLELAKNNQLPDWLVQRMAPFMGGGQYQIGQEAPPGISSFQSFHVADGNQDFALHADPSLSAEQINQRISLIDQMLQALPATGDAGRQALQQQRNVLAGRVAHLAK
jgi:hypothetical protein